VALQGVWVYNRVPLPVDPDYAALLWVKTHAPAFLQQCQLLQVILLNVAVLFSGDFQVYHTVVMLNVLLGEWNGRDLPRMGFCTLKK
jgi:hypothetical protein